MPKYTVKATTPSGASVSGKDYSFNDAIDQAKRYALNALDSKMQGTRIVISQEGVDAAPIFDYTTKQGDA